MPVEVQVEDLVVQQTVYCAVHLKFAAIKSSKTSPMGADP
jgi:hypothetical protein